MNCVERTSFGPMFIVGASGSLSVMLTNSDGARVRSRAAASADFMAHENWWWIGRVLVVKDEDRGKGVGSLILQRLLKEITTSLIAEAGNIVVPHAVVAPGGYSDNIDGQMRFYLKNGFEQVAGEDGLLGWRALV